MAAGNADDGSGVTRRHVVRLAMASWVVAIPLPSAIAHGVVAPVAQLFGQDLGGMAASLLAQWISELRQAILAAGTQPVPPHIIQGLSGYFPPALLQSVRYHSGGNTELTLPGLAFQYGDAAAITLVDVVVFHNDADAQVDLKLWAHELTHVMQYRRWGIDGFAARYIADSNAVEREAYGNADRFVAWRTSERR